MICRSRRSSSSPLVAGAVRLHGDGGDVRHRGDELELELARVARLGVVHGEGAEHLRSAPRIGSDQHERKSAARASSRNGTPVGVLLHVAHDHALAGEGGRAAAAAVRADLHPVHRAVVVVGQARRGAVAQALSLAQQHRAAQARDDRLGLGDHERQHAGQRLAARQLLHDAPERFEDRVAARERGACHEVTPFQPAGSNRAHGVSRRRRRGTWGAGCRPGASLRARSPCPVVVLEAACGWRTSSTSST